jgi:creatinine amidohydrolase
MTHQWDALTRDEITELAPHALLVIPLGALEQHGPHLATGTDSLIVGEIASRACARAARPAAIVVAPTLPVGASEHHLPFGGTLSISPSTLSSLLRDVVASAAEVGFRRVLLLNGHGGNAATCKVVCSEATTELDLQISCLSYWDVLSEQKPEWQLVPGHAGAFETALVLALRPERVRSDRVRPSPAPLRGSARNVSPSTWREIDGFTDDPRAATGALGHEILASAVEAVAAAIEGIGEDQDSA